MTVYQIIDILSHEKIALSFLSMVLLLVAFGTRKAAGASGNTSPYNYIFSAVTVGACIPGVISIVLWLHAICFDQKGLWELDFFVFYLPVITMIACIMIIRQCVSFGELPWFGELYELFIITFITFGFIIVTIEKEVFNFSNGWHVIFFFVLLFGLLKTSWERFFKIR